MSTSQGSGTMHDECRVAHEQRQQVIFDVPMDAVKVKVEAQTQQQQKPQTSTETVQPSCSQQEIEQRTPVPHTPTQHAAALSTARSWGHYPSTLMVPVSAISAFESEEDRTVARLQEERANLLAENQAWLGCCKKIRGENRNLLLSIPALHRAYATADRENKRLRKQVEKLLANIAAQAHAQRVGVAKLGNAPVAHRKPPLGPIRHGTI